MALLSARQISKFAASRVLFEDLSFTIHDQERVGLIGPNGAGKSSLLRILADLDRPDEGTVDRRSGSRIAYLPQVDTFTDEATVESALLEAVRDLPLEDHEPGVRVRKMIRRLGFADPAQPVATLSGGWRKRVALGCLLVQEPDALLMDEPTNHLDLEGILWLESFLERASFAFIVTTHDRTFLERVTRRVVEVDARYPTGVLSVRGRYADFLVQREQVLRAMDRDRTALANEVRREVQWLRQGPKARSSKASHRVDQAHRKIDQLSAAMHRGRTEADIMLNFRASTRQTNDLIVASGLRTSLGGRLLFEGLDVRVLRGTRLGIVGNNASGKTTLLRILTGEAVADSGSVRSAQDLRIAVFDQQRSQLDLREPLRRALAPQGDIVAIPGQGMHVIAWAKRFGFRADQLSMPLGELSGGEQARVLMAMMMREPADVLFLDEPTNDLDITSIEVLEDALLSFPGAVVLITHDRSMLDRVCTDLIGLHGDGRWGVYGCVDQWVNAANQHDPTIDEADVPPRRQIAEQAAPRKPSLSYHEKREFAGIEQEILDAEATLKQLEMDMQTANHAADHASLQDLFESREAAARRVSELYTRWEELDARAHS